MFEYISKELKGDLAAEERSEGLFVLVDTRGASGRRPTVELHQLEANATCKFIKVWTVDARNFKSYAKILKKKGLHRDEPLRESKSGVQVEHSLHPQNPRA